MVTCPRCGRGNEGKYRFCLGCGAALAGNDMRQTGAAAIKPAVRPSQPPPRPSEPVDQPPPAAAAPPARGSQPAPSAPGSQGPLAPTARSSSVNHAVDAAALDAMSGQTSQELPAATLSTPASALQLPPRPPSTAVKSPAAPRPADPKFAPDEAATAAVSPVFVAAAKRVSGTQRAHRKSQQIQPVVVDAVQAEVAKPAPAPEPPAQPSSVGLAGGTLRQGGRAVAAPRSEMPPRAELPPRNEAMAKTGAPVDSRAAGQLNRAAAILSAPASPSAPPVMRYSQPVPPPGSRPGSEVAPMPSPRPVPAPPPPGQHPCHACRAPIPANNAFCGSCGAANPHHSPTLPILGQAPKVDRVGYVALIDDNGGESVQFPLLAGENRIGSGDSCQLRFPDDGFLARVHCAVDAEPNRVVLRPLDHSNGTYLRITTPIELHHGEIVRIGQEILKFERFDRLVPETNSDGLPETVGWTPPRGVWGRLCQLGLQRQVANAYLLQTPDVFLGRERGDILFPRDGFVSGSHAVLSDRNGRSFLKDLGSSNGTFVKVKHETPLRNGDLFLLGRNLLRVHLGNPG